MLLLPRPREHRVLRFIPDDEFANSIMIDISQPDSTIPTVVAGENWLAVQLQAIEQRTILDPVFAIESPCVRGSFVAHEHHSRFVGRNYAEADSSVVAVAGGID